MKKTTLRIFALLFVVAMISCMFVGCGKSKMNVSVGVQLGEDYINYRYAEEELKGNTEFMIPAEHRNFLNDVNVEIAYAEGEQVSALDAFINACVEYDLDYTLDSTGKSVTVINDYTGFSGKDEEGTVITFFWSYTINGVEPTSGRAADNYVKDGDKIVFTLTSASADDFDEDSYQ